MGSEMCIRDSLSSFPRTGRLPHRIERQAEILLVHGDNLGVDSRMVLLPLRSHLLGPIQWHTVPYGEGNVGLLFLVLGFLGRETKRCVVDNHGRLIHRRNSHEEVRIQKEGLRLAMVGDGIRGDNARTCLLYTSPSPRDLSTSRMPSSA